VALEILSGAGSVRRQCDAVERQLNAPFHERRANPFRFFAVAAADSFHLGLAYDHSSPAASRLALLLKGDRRRLFRARPDRTGPLRWTSTPQPTAIILRHPWRS
jgi:hypothetical protein